MGVPPSIAAGVSGYTQRLGINAGFESAWEAMQTQEAYSGATTGTSPSFVLTLSPVPGALTLSMHVQAQFHAAGGATNTLNVNTLGAVTMKQRDSAGSLVNFVPALGQIVELVYDGTYWVVPAPLPSGNSGRLLGVTYYTAGGTYTKGTNNPTFVIVEGCGGGASGGSVYDSSKANLATGGGAGGYFKKKILASDLASSVTVTIGAGGARANNGNGKAGGTTSFGSHCSADGGSAGTKTSSASAVSLEGASGGAATGGDINVTGGGSSAVASAATTSVIGMASAGGNSFFGGGGVVKVAEDAGAGGGPGAGGGGYAASTGGVIHYSGKGADGIVIVWEYS